MGIDTFLKSMAGKHSKSGAGASAPAPKLPAMDSKTTKSYEKLETTLGGIQEKMRKLGTSSGAAKELDKLAKKARKLQPLYQAIQKVKKAEDEWHKTLKDETKTINDQTKAYNKLAAAKDHQVKVGNEMGGMGGRMKNVAASFSKANVALAAFAVVGREVLLVAHQGNEGFDVMARSGQALGKTWQELTASTAKYALGLNKASISGMMMGFAAQDSKKAFQILTQTFGGTGDAVENVSNNFGTMAKVAKFSGMSIGDAALYADKNWKRLGKTMEQSTQDIAQMGLNTQHLNALFGAGKVDTREYAQTVSDLSFQSGNYNQNTKFLIESLNRELAVQLSLGKSRDAAMDAARRNLEKAGKANILGAQLIGRKLQAEFDSGVFDGPEGKEKAKERFGSEYEVVLQILKEGIDTKNNMFALAEIMKDSSELQGVLNKEIKEDARRGGTVGLSTKVLNFGEQMELGVQERARRDKFQAIRDVDRTKEGGPQKLTDLVAELFPGVAKMEDGPDKVKANELITEFGTLIRADKELDAFAAFDTLVDRLAPEVKPGKSKNPTETFLEEVRGAGFIETIGVLNNLPGVIEGLPMTMAAALAAQKMEEEKVFDWVKSVIGADEAGIRKRETTPRPGRRGRPGVSPAQAAAARAKYAEQDKRKELGASYDAGMSIKGKDGKPGTSAVRGKTKEEFIEEKMRTATLNEAFGEEGAAVLLASEASGDSLAESMTKLGLDSAPPATVPAAVATDTAKKATVAGAPGSPEVIQATASRSGNKWLLEFDGDTMVAQSLESNTAVENG
jgi:hypothetical protein